MEQRPKLGNWRIWRDCHPAGAAKGKLDAETVRWRFKKNLPYMASHEGKMTLLKAGAEWEILAVNDLEDDEIHATPALSDGRIYVRTHSSLFCFGTWR
jgi:hypothetical protein